MIDLTIVTPLYNQSHLTKRCLESVLKNSTSKYEVVVVDNASSDDTPELTAHLKEAFESEGVTFTIIRNEKNVGFGRAMNQGARAAKGKYLALLNNDTWLMPGWDSKLIESIEKNNADMVCPFYYEKSFEEGKMEQIAEAFISKNNGKRTSEWGSILMFFKRESFEKVGMFDEDYFVTYEDTDLMERCDKMGMKYYLVGDSFIWHHSKGTRDEDAAPSKLEEEGLSIFMSKWNFDPRVRRNTFFAKKLRSFRKFKRNRGLL